MKRAFVQVCLEHACPNGPELPLFSSGTKIPTFRVMTHHTLSSVFVGARCRDSDLLLTIYNENLVLPDKPNDVDLSRLMDINRGLTPMGVIVDSFSKAILVVGYVMEGNAWKSDRERKRRLWDFINRLYATWESIALELNAMTNEGGDVTKEPLRKLRMLTDSTETTVASYSVSTLNSTDVQIEEMTEQITALWYSRGHTTVQRQKNILFVAVKNLGATLSQDALVFPWLFKISKRIVTITSIFSLDGKPYKIPEERFVYLFVDLTIAVNSRLKIGTFKVKFNEREVYFVHQFPYNSVKLGEMQVVMNRLMDVLTNNYKLYANAFIQLVRHLNSDPLPISIESLVTSSELIRPLYSGHSTPLLRHPKSFYFTRNFTDNFDQFLAEQRKHNQLTSAENIQEFILTPAVVFDDKKKEISCVVKNAVPFRDLKGDYLKNVSLIVLMSSILRLAQCINMASFYLERIEKILYIQGDEIRLLPWKLSECMTENRQSLTQFTSLLSILDDFTKFPVLFENLPPESIISPCEIEKIGGKLYFDGEVVSLKPVKTYDRGDIMADELCILFQLIAPIVCRLPVFQHIKGSCEVVDVSLGVLPGRYRLEAEVQPVQMMLGRNSSMQHRISVLLTIGKELMSLHSLGYRCLGLNPRTVGMVNGQVVFLHCAMHVCMIPLWPWEEMDVRYLAPELVRALLVSSSYRDLEVDDSADVYSFAMLVTELLQTHDSDTKPLSYTPAHLHEIDRANQAGFRPIISNQFEESYPLTTCYIRLGLEDASQRPALKDIMENLISEVDSGLTSIEEFNFDEY